APGLLISPRRCRPPPRPRSTLQGPAAFCSPPCSSASGSASSWAGRPAPPGSAPSSGRSSASSPGSRPSTAATGTPSEMKAELFSTPRPEPSHLLPTLGSGLVVLLALPVFLVGGWSIGGWALAAVIWVAVHGIDALLLHARAGAATLARSGVQAFGLFFKAVGLLVVLVAAALA